MLLEEKQEAYLKTIKTIHSGDAKECCFDMLQYWMRTHPEATWDHLVTALKSPGVELIAVASAIERGKTLLCTHVPYGCNFQGVLIFVDFVDPTHHENFL